MQKKHQGFTLIELLVVIAIIGLLSTLAVVALNSARQRSRDAKRVADIRQIQTALELGFSENSAYPTGITGCGTAAGEACSAVLGSATATSLCKKGSASVWSVGTSGCSTIYMGLVPSNPAPNGANYLYVPGATAASYSIFFNLEGATGQLSSGANCANQNGITSTVGC